MISLDAGLQEMPVDDATLYIPPLRADGGRHMRISMPLRETAKLLVAAQNPVIVVDRAARSQDRHRPHRAIGRGPADTGHRPGAAG